MAETCQDCFDETSVGHHHAQPAADVSERKRLGITRHEYSWLLAGQRKAVQELEPLVKEWEAAADQVESFDGYNAGWNDALRRAAFALTDKLAELRGGRDG